MEIKGQFNTARVLIDNVDEETLRQIKNIVNHPAFEGDKIVIMPDCHAGAGTVIGFTMKMNEYVIPNVVGVDIGCGIETYKLGKIDIDFKDLDDFIKNNIPSGFDRRKRPAITSYEKGFYDEDFEERLKDLSAKLNLGFDVIINSIGTLGGGNHFLEVDKDDDGNYWFTIHTGSRHFGLEVAQYHQKKAKKLAKGKKEIENFHGLEYLKIDNGGKEYLEDMKIAQRYAQINRIIIARYVVNKYFGLDINKVEIIRSVHNYINFEDNIIRKGAISAHKGEKLIIPLNMRDGIIIGEGKGLKSWNYSAPHGAGRILSRTQAKKSLSLEEFKKSMEGIWTSCIRHGTIDESPMAYKPSEWIIEAIKENVEILYMMKPVYNFKAEE